MELKKGRWNWKNGSINPETANDNREKKPPKPEEAPKSLVKMENLGYYHTIMVTKKSHLSRATIKSRFIAITRKFRIACQTKKIWIHIIFKFSKFLIMNFQKKNLHSIRIVKDPRQIWGRCILGPQQTSVKSLWIWDLSPGPARAGQYNCPTIAYNRKARSINSSCWAHWCRWWCSLRLVVVWLSGLFNSALGSLQKRYKSPRIEYADHIFDTNDPLQDFSDTTLWAWSLPRWTMDPWLHLGYRGLTRNWASRTAPSAKRLNKTCI